MKLPLISLIFLSACGSFVIEDPEDLTGPRGATGATGVGAAGTNGTNGTNGVTGVTGSDGTDGVDGANGLTGADGSDGINGATGATGSTGATGPSGAAPLGAYAHIYNEAAQVVALEAAVQFDTNGLITAGFSHTAGASNIEVISAGVYRVSWIVTAVEPNQFTLFANGAALPGATFGSGAGTQQNQGEVIVALSDNASLTLVNHSSAAAVTLQTLAGGTQANVNTSLIIERL